MELPLNLDNQDSDYPNQLMLHCDNGEIIPFIVSDDKIDYELEKPNENERKKNPI